MDTPSGDKDVGTTDETTTRPRVSPRIWIAGIAVAVLVVVCAIPIALTATPGQCASCHEMKPYFDSWQSSSHRAAAPNCLYCHVKPGVFNLVGYEVGFYREIAGHFAGSQVTSSAANAPSVESCSRPTCHSLNRETSNSGDLKINHRLHVTQANVPCSRCHPGAVHTGVGGRLKLPPMKICKECHADKMQQCNFCHTQEHLQVTPGAH
jgi:hypothetical protein